MKKNVIILLLTKVVFGLLTILTASIKTPADGNDTYGFPFTFYTKIGGMVDPSPTSPDDLIRKNYFFLVLDLAFALLTSVIGLMIYNHFKRKSQTNNSQ